MADGSETRMSAGPVVPKQSASSLVAGIKAFATAHGGAKAVIEFVGRRGARIVLVGGDGEWGDQLAPSTDVARRACEKAGVELQNEWERELVELMRPSNDLWRSMSRRTMSR
jgi:hypothetical protein